jgi:hypothetical protein
VVAISGRGDSLGRMERHSMRKVREVLRLRASGLNHRAISASTGISKGSVSDYLRRAVEAGLDWEAALAMSEADVEARLFKYGGRNEPPKRAPIDMTWVHHQGHRMKSMIISITCEFRIAESSVS